MRIFFISTVGTSVCVVSEAISLPDGAVWRAAAIARARTSYTLILSVVVSTTESSGA
jgi:hypothetical protein